MNMQHAYSCLLLACALLHAATAYPFFHEPNALHRCPAAPSTAPPVATASSTDGPATRVNMHHPVIIAFAAVFAVCVALIAAFAVRRRLASCDTSKSVSHDGEQDAIQYGYVDDVFGTVAWFAMCTATLLLQLSLGALCLDFYLDLRIFGSDVFSAFIVMWHVSCIWLVVVFAAGDWLADAFRIPTTLEFATTVRVVTPRASPGGTLDRLARLYLRRFGAGALDDVGVRKVRHGVPTAEPPGKPRDLVHDLVQRFVDWNAHDAIDVAVEDGSITVRCLRMPFDRHLGRFRSAPAESNALEFPSLTVSQAVRAELFGLFYVYQLHMLWVWAIFSYWRMSACSLVLVVTALVFKVRAAVSADRKVRELASAHSMATCVVVTPDGDVPVPVARLRPGDRVRIASESTVPADLVLLQGEVVVDESMLTGESRPVRKFPAANAQDKGRQHQLWSGTSVIQSAATSEAIVAATGASTLKGQLLREILFPAAVEFVFDNELAIVILILCTWGIVGGLCTVALLNGTDGTWFYSMCSITCVLSPMLPAMLVVGQAVASRRLASKRVNCTQMTRIALAGKVSVACFDKTGTLTRSGLEFSSVHAIERRSFHARPSDAVDDLPGLLRLALGTAHSLSALEDGRLVGNAVDLEMFKKSGCAMDGSVVRCGDQRVEIVRVLPFEHGRQRMSVVVRDLSSGALSLFCKGSPEQVAALADPALLPTDFDSVVKRHAREGHYTLAVAHRPVSSDDLSGSREHLERHLSVLGVVMFVNPLKPCTTGAIAELAPSTRCVMVTGDTALTGICIARRCGMIPTGRRVLLGACRGPPPGSAVFWVDAANGHPVDDDDVNDADVELAVTSRAFHAFVEQGRLGDLLPRVRVFGRMRPDDKVACIRAHQDAGAIVAMVGDGANDSAALRAAHVGLALSESDASFVAPFSTDSGTIGAFVDLVRHGRAALATNLAAYRFLVLYGEVLIVAKLLSAYFSVVMDEAVWMALDVAVSIGLSAALTTARPSPGPLSSRRPTARLLGPETLSATIGTIAINVAFFAVVVAWMFHQSSWYLCHEWDGRTLDNMMAWWLLADNYEAGIIGIVTFAQVAIVAAVANLGGPFRAAWIRNRVFVVVLGAYVALWSAVVLGGTNALSCLFHVNCSRASNEMPVRARLDLFAIVVANAVAVWAYHYVVVFGPGRRWFQRQGNAASDTVSKSVAVSL